MEGLPKSSPGFGWGGFTDWPQCLADFAASTAFFLLPPTEGDEPSLIQTNLLEG